MPFFEVALFIGIGKHVKNNIDDTIGKVGDETKEILNIIKRDVEELIDQLDDTFKENWNFAINDLDEFTQKKLFEIGELFEEINGHLQDTAKLILETAEGILKDLQVRLNQTIKELEESLRNIIIVAGETATYVLHRATYNTLTILSLALLGIGLMLFILSLAKNGVPTGLGGILYLSFLGIFIGLFGALSFIPQFRKWIIRYTGLGLKAKLTPIEATPHIFDIRPSIIKLGKTQELEIIGFDLLHKDEKPSIEIGGQSVKISADSNETIIVKVDDLRIPTGSNNIIFKYSDGSEARAIIRIDKDELPDLRIVDAKFLPPKFFLVVNEKIKFRIVIKNFGKSKTGSFKVLWRPTLSHIGFERMVYMLGEYGTGTDTEIIEFEHTYKEMGMIDSIVDVDVRREVEESDENNNRKTIRKGVARGGVGIPADLDLGT